MSGQEEYPRVLDDAKAAASQNPVILGRVLESLNAAAAGSEHLLEAFSIADAGVQAARARVEQDAVSVQQAIEHDEEANTLHVRAGYQDNEDALTIRKQLAEAGRLLGRASRGFIHLQQQLDHGVGAEISSLRSSVVDQLLNGIGIGRSMIEVGSGAYQDGIIAAIDAYIERRKRERAAVKESTQKLEDAKTAIAPPEEEAATTEGKVTPEGLAQRLGSAASELNAMAPALTNNSAKVERLQQIYNEVGGTLTSWTTAPESVKATYLSIGATLEELGVLPVADTAISDAVVRIQGSESNFLATKTAFEFARNFMNLCAEYADNAINKLKKYLGRRA